MSDKISHEGVIDKIDKEQELVCVRIVQTTACAACKIAGHCNASESKVKVVEVRNASNIKELKVGQLVTVWASRNVMGKALLLGFGLPLVVMATVLITTLLLTGNEGFSALMGIGALVPYYGLLWFMREHISSHISFHLETND